VAATDRQQNSGLSQTGACAESIATALPNTRTAAAKKQSVAFVAPTKSMGLVETKRNGSIPELLS
jgi:hypothetical protein